MKKHFLILSILFLVKSTCLNGQTVNFGSPVDYVDGGTPLGAASADFDNDGNVDIASMQFSGNVIILKGNGGGNFVIHNTITSGNSSLMKIKTSDLNNDNNVDIVLLTGGVNGEIIVCYGLGNGLFNPLAHYAINTVLSDFTINDFNGDGYLDIAVSQMPSNYINMLLGSANGVFTNGAYFGEQYSVNQSNWQISSLSSADFNNDGKMDIITANRNSNNLSVFIGVGNGTFLQNVKFPVNLSPNTVITDDFNNDGRIDVAVSNSNSDNISILTGLGNGNFLTHYDLMVGDGPSNLVCSDFNNDGFKDLATTNGGSGNISILLGNNTGSFNSTINFVTNYLPNNSLIASDFNNDGKKDLEHIAAIQTPSNTRVTILFNESICPQIATNISSQTNASCFGASNGAATINATGGTSFTYAWSPTGGSLTTATGIAAGTYNCLVTNQCGNTATQQIVITQPLANNVTSGPAGVGTNVETEMWFDASRLGSINNTPVTSWTDRSGNFKHATQTSATNKPMLLTNQINGFPAVNFDGVNDYLSTSSVADLNTDKQTWFVVTKANNNTHNGQIIGSGYTSGATTGSDHFWKTVMNAASGKYVSFIRNNAGTATNIFSNYDTQYHIISNVWDGNSDTHTMFTDGSLNGTVTGRNASPTGHLRVRLGTNSGTTLTYWYNGRIAEAFVYSKTLNEAERIIVENYLSTKYNIPLTGLDIFSYQNTHKYDAAGIGMINNTQVVSAKADIVEISQPSALQNNDFMMWAHNNGAYIANTVDVPSAYISTSGERMQRVWRAGKTNDLGTVTLTFYLSNIMGGTLSDLELLMDNDGTFTNASRITNGFSYDDACGIATWTGVNLTDGQYFTLGSVNGVAILNSGDAFRVLNNSEEEQIEEQKEFKLFPNPSAGEFELVFNELSSNTMIEIYNSLGQIVVKKAIIDYRTQLDITNEPNGIYFVKVLNSNNTVAVKKIIKQ